MNPKKQLSGATVWTGADTTKADLTVPASHAIVSKLVELIRREPVRSKQCGECTREDFAEAGLAELGAHLATNVLDPAGAGVAILSRLPTEALSLDELEKALFAIGLYVGTPVTQSARGDLMGYVQDLTWRPGGEPFARGYTSRGELRLHTDTTDCTALMPVRVAKRGGTTYLASAAAIYNALLEEHPEALEILERGFPYDRRGEQGEGQPDVSSPMPFFASRSGVFSCRYVPHHRLPADYRLTLQEKAAWEAFDAVADRLSIVLDLEPGEILFSNNFQTLHARTEFEDHDEPERKRLLLRLWLQPATPRPVDARQREPGWWGWPAKPQLLAAAHR